MSATQTQAGPEHYVNEAIALTKPNADYRLVANNIMKADAGFANYNLQPTSKKDRDKAFNQAAAAYLGSIFGIGYDDPTMPGSQLKAMVQRMPDGSETLGRIYAALERGEKPALLNELNRIWKSQGVSNRLEMLLSEVRGLPDEQKMAFYGNIAQMLGNVDGYEGSAVSVAENPSGAISGLQQRMALAESVSKTQGAGHSVH